MPTSRRRAAVSRSDSLNFSAFAFDVLLWSMVRSSAVVFKLPSASRRESSWARYLLRADLELVRLLVQRHADLLDVRLARDIEQLLLNVRHFAVDDLVRHLAAVGRQLDAEEARKNEEEGRHLVARDMHRRDGLGDGEVDGQGEAVVVKVLFARSDDALELRDLFAQALIFRLQLLVHLCQRGLNLEELAVGLHLVAHQRLLQPFAPRAQHD
eukprot:6183462-Pleurochrysis_carterae.AAC.5